MINSSITKINKNSFEWSRREWGRIWVMRVTITLCGWKEKLIGINWKLLEEKKRKMMKFLFRKFIGNFYKNSTKNFWTKFLEIFLAKFWDLIKKICSPSKAKFFMFTQSPREVTLKIHFSPVIKLKAPKERFIDHYDPLMKLFMIFPAHFTFA